MNPVWKRCFSLALLTSAGFPGCDDGAGGTNRLTGAALPPDVGAGSGIPGRDADAVTPTGGAGGAGGMDERPNGGTAGAIALGGAGGAGGAGGTGGQGGHAGAESDPGGHPAAPDAASPGGAPAPDAAVGGHPAPDAGLPMPDAAPPPPPPPPPVCGDGRVEGAERCDDGMQVVGCEVNHDGGDGACVPPGDCSPGFVAGAGDVCSPFEQSPGVDIFVDNFCNMDVRPAEVHVPAGAFIQITWHNRSVDYPVDVWLSYGGGFLDLEPGTEWADRFEFCHGGERPYRAGADISTACSEFQFVIYCD